MRIALVAVVALLAAPSMAVAAPPSAPGAPVLSVVDDARTASVDATWSGAADADGIVVAYAVEYAPIGEAYATQLAGASPAARVTGLRRGRVWRVRVTAIDDAGERSAPSAETVIDVPRLPVELRSALRANADGLARACAVVRDACTIERRAGARLELIARPATALGGVGVQVELLHRAPGASRFVRIGARRVVLGASASSSMPLAQLVRRAGTWCLRSRVEPADDIAPLRAATSCVRWRPPIELGWAGDTVVGSSWGLPPNGGRDQLAQVARLLRAPELMIGNYEGTLSRGGSPRCSGGAPCFIFQAPPERARNLRVAGFDVMNLANNHGLDMGLDARRQTVRALAAVDIDAAGLPGAVTVRRVQDTRVAIVGMSPYPGTTSMRSPEAIRTLVQAARRRADVVVMCFHAGLEGAAGAHVPGGMDAGVATRAATHAAIDAGADVVFGSGPHVVRGVERYRGRYIVYSAGNFAGWHNFALNSATTMSGVVRMTMSYTGRPVAAAWDAVRIQQPGIPVPDRSGAVVRRVASLSRADFGARGARFTASGRFR